MLSSRTAVIEDFCAGVTAVFCYRPDLKGTVYEAVNDQCPLYFLTEQCVTELKSRTEKKLPVIATIVLITACEAPKSNPYSLPEGATYFEVIAQQLDPRHPAMSPASAPGVRH